MVDPLTPGAGERRRRELEALLLLDALPGVGPRRVREVVGAAGSARAALADPRLLRERAGEAAAAAATSGEAREGVLHALERADRMGMATVLFTEPAYPRASGAGSITVNRLPLPSWLSTETRPPQASTRCFTMDRPKPVPPSSRERPLSTR